jgi:HK97 family phage portal protein
MKIMESKSSDKPGFLDRVISWFSIRQSLESPKTPLSAPAAWLYDTLGGKPTLSGARINEQTALQISTVWACVEVISQSIGSLPLFVYKPLEPRGREKAFNQREFGLLHNSPNERMTSCIFREVMTIHVLLWGNAYALIEYDRSGKTRALWPILPYLVAPQLLPDRSLEYLVKDNVSGKEVPYPASEIIHIPGLSFDGVSGLSPIRQHREGIGLAQALEQFGAEYFGQGTAPSGVLQINANKTLSDPAKERLGKSWQQFHGVPGQRHKVPILEEGMEFKPITLQADHAQFIESRKFQISEIARIFRVPAHMVGDLERATFSNIEHQSLEFVEYTLRPWLVRWEQELNRKLFPKGDHFVEFNIDGLLRGDFNTRMSGYATGRQWGWWSVNEIREKEGMNPLPDKEGDQYLVPANMTTPEKIENPPKPTPPPVPAAPSDNGEEKPEMIQ